MRNLPLLIPLLFMTFVSLGLARPETLIVSCLFALSILAGIWAGERVKWRDNGLGIEEKHVIWAFWISIALVFIQILMLGNVPLLNPAVRTSLSPRLTALTYFLGVPASVYLFLRGRRYALLYPFVVALYAYRTPILVSLLAIGGAYYETAMERKGPGGYRIAGLLLLALLLGVGIGFMRGETLQSLWTRIQGTTSVLDVIILRTGWHGFYHGELQFSGIQSYIIGGYSPRGLIAKFLYIKTGATITGTLLGGIYLDFGIFSLLEGFILGLYYGTIKEATATSTLALYYSTLAYGLVGVETGILDLPVYLLFILGAYVVIDGLRR
ncbi:hypothetical protein A3L12_01115 [Thermococcus sp. P6]|uniref:hypothetical protein n=1 Tax=Thermococcus sp. P6 TaxID=122420 RepID=UPI000B5A1BCE|nr:hypothetical protein [Thermococcus sp. P6]ASJ09995.1 hypothetical protein A3L12_01115 [Thermococcus sp. P6]